jgi:hypothetical protein
LHSGVSCQAQKAGKSNAITTSPQTQQPATCERLADFFDSLAARFGKLAGGIIFDAPVSGTHSSIAALYGLLTASLSKTAI